MLVLLLDVIALPRVVLSLVEQYAPLWHELPLLLRAVSLLQVVVLPLVYALAHYLPQDVLALLEAHTQQDCCGTHSTLLVLHCTVYHTRFVSWSFSVLRTLLVPTIRQFNFIKLCR